VAGQNVSHNVEVTMSKTQNVKSQYVESHNVDKWEMSKVKMSKVNISKCRMVTYTSYMANDQNGYKNYSATGHPGGTVPLM